MKTAALAYALPLALLLAFSGGSPAVAQSASDPQHPDAPGAATQAPSSSAPGARSPGAMGQAPMGPGMMGPGMMGPGMMGPGMMGPGMMMGAQGYGMAGGAGIHGHRMKIMFAIADANGDGALSFDEVTAIHKRIFAAIDADDDGKVTPEEVRTFMSVE